MTMRGFAPLTPPLLGRACQLFLFCFGAIVEALADIKSNSGLVVSQVYMNEMIYIQKRGNGKDGLSRYSKHICSFICNVILLSNSCELILDQIFHRLGIQIGSKATLGEKISKITNSKVKFSKFVQVDSLEGCLIYVNFYFKIAKHATMFTNESVTNKKIDNLADVMFVTRNDGKIHKFSPDKVKEIISNIQQCVYDLQKLLQHISRKDRID